MNEMESRGYKPREELEKTREGATQLYEDIRKYATEMGLSHECFDNTGFREKIISRIDSYLKQELIDGLRYGFHGGTSLCETMIEPLPEKIIQSE